MAEKNELYDALSAPLADLIASVGHGVAQAQQAIDRSTIESFKLMYSVQEDGLLADMRALGYQPTWYRIPEVKAEMTMALTIGEHTDIKGTAPIEGLETSRGLKLFAAPIDANYTNKYGYQIQGASKISFSIVPVPPTPRAEQIKIVPHLAGKTLKEADYLLQVLDIDYEVVKTSTSDPSGYKVVPPEEATEDKILAGSVRAVGAILKAGEVLRLILGSGVGSGSGRGSGTGA